MYFAGGSTAILTGNLNLTGSAGRYVVLRSTASGVHSSLVVTGNHTVSYVDVKDNDASNGTQIIASSSTDSGNNLNWDFAAPSVVTLTASAGQPRQIVLSWAAPSDDGVVGTALNGQYRINYGTNLAAVAAASTASAQIVISTNGVTPGLTVSTSVINLSFGVTYYFKLNTVDDVGRWSG